MVVNKVYSEGNSIFIKSNPITGILALTSFTDDSSGETGGRSFTKTFRYSLNGVIFSDWQALTTPNILAIPVTNKSILVIELEYQKNPVGSNALGVTSATIGTTDGAITETDLFKNSIFYQFFQSNDVQVLNWMINVLEKLFHKGILPNYIDRYNDFGSPDDFLEFWGGVCKFFAYYVVYARQFQNFYQSEALLSEYLEERGLKVSRDNSLEQLQALMQYFNREVARRGTYHIVDQEGINGSLIDGELLRLINFTDGDEFLFNPNKSEHFGWNLENSSPNYRSVTIHDNLNKFYEQGTYPSDITKYPTVGTVSVITDGQKKVLSISGNSGIGNDPTFKIPVNEYMDYEFSFFIKKTDGNNLTVGFDAYDADGNAIDLISRTNGAVLNNFLTTKNVQRSDKYIYCTFFLYGKLKPLYSNDLLNLKMVDDVHYVVPKILIGAGSANIYNIRFVPMALPYSKGFIQVNNFIDCIIKNNNSQYSLFDIEKYVKKYLIPYSSHIHITETEKAGDYSLETFIAPPANPVLATVTTANPFASGINTVLGGSVTNDGGSPITEEGVVWSVSANPTLADNRVAIRRDGAGNFSKAVADLPSGTNIHVRAYVINGQGVSYGNDEAILTTVIVNSLNISSANPTNAGTIQFTCVFSSAVTGVTAANFNLVTSGITGASIASVTGSGTTYVITVNTGTGDGTIRLNVANTTGIDQTVSNVPFNGQVYTIDKTAPVVTINTHPSSLSNSSSAAFTFSAVDSGGSGLAQILVSMDGGAFVASTSPKNYTGLADGSHTFHVKAVDNVGNASSEATFTWNIDTVAPTVLSINRQSPLGASTTASSVVFRISFSKDVTGVDITDFILTTTGATVGTIVSVTQILPNVYDVTVNGISGAGSIRLDLKATGTGIQDASGNPVTGGYTTGQSYTITVAVHDVTITPSVRLDGSTAGADTYYGKFLCSEALETAVTVNWDYRHGSGGATLIGGDTTIDAGSTESDEFFIDSVSNPSLPAEIIINTITPSASGSQNYVAG